MPGLDVDAGATGDTVALLQQLIRNACVNDGRPESGHEHRSAADLAGFLAGPGLDVETFEPTPGRTSVVARIEGSVPGAPTLCLMGHTDVVPVNPAGWSRDPFGGELVDGEVWGRGAIDMLNLTSSMAVAVRRLARSGWRPRGTLVYLGVADEEAGGVHGAEWLVEHARDAVRADYVVTESGGWHADGPFGHAVVLTVAEKGLAWRRLRVRGTPAHGSMPYGADNALVKAAEVVRLLTAYRPVPQLDALWSELVATLPVDEEVRAQLLDPQHVEQGIARLPSPRLRAAAHACSHLTISPNVVQGGTKTNIVPDEVVLEVDIRTLPGQTMADVDVLLADLLGPLAADVVVEPLHEREASASPLATPLAAALGRVTRAAFPDAVLTPRLTPGGTDAAFYRGIGAVAYGFGLFSRQVTAESFGTRFHGNDERVDVESLALTTAAWDQLCRDLLG